MLEIRREAVSPLLHPGPGEYVPAADPGAYAEALERFGAPPRSGPALRLAAGVSLTLDGTAGLPLAARTLVTADLEELKSWIGVPDAVAPPAQRAELPSGPWRGAARASHELTGEERRDVDRAAQVYLFGDSRQVATYRRVIELCHGPFEADLRVASSIVVEPGASLIVRGRPTVLLIGGLELHSGGKIYLHTITSLIVGRMYKLNRFH